MQGGHKVLSLETKKIITKRKVKEAIEITLRRPSLNRDPGLDLPAVYDPILRSTQATYALPAPRPVSLPNTPKPAAADEGGVNHRNIPT